MDDLEKILITLQHRNQNAVVCEDQTLVSQTLWLYVRGR